MLTDVPSPTCEFDPHAAARLLGKAKYLAQAEARAFADLLGGEERLERLGANLLGHAGAGVGDGDLDVVAGRRLFRVERRAAA